MRTFARKLAAICAALALTMGAAGTAAATQASPLIVGGSDATEQYGAVSIQYPGVHHRCGGSLITDEWVVTAAHCTVIIIPGSTQIRVGSLDRTTGGELVGVTDVFVNPDFVPSINVGGDIALVHLSKPVDAQPIPIAPKAGRPGTLTRIAGWGLLCKDPSDPACQVLPTRLQQLDTMLLPAERCTLIDPQTGMNQFDPRSELCTISADNQPRMACNGDSGGPQVRWMFGRWWLIGVTSRDADDLVSRVHDCNTAPDGSPGKGVWTNVPHYFGWLDRTIEQHSGDHAARELRELTANQADFGLAG